MSVSYEGDAEEEAGPRTARSASDDKDRVGVILDTIGRKYRFEFDLSAWPICHKIYRHIKRLEGLTTRLEFRPQFFNCLNNSCTGFSWRLDVNDYVVTEVPIRPSRLNRRDDFSRRIIEKPAR